MSQDAPQQPLSELDLLNGYLRVRALQFGREGHRLWIINGCADADITTALTCARWAADQPEGHIPTPVRTLNLASDQPTLRALEQTLAPYQSISVNLLGSLESSLEHLLRTIGSSPAFIMFDPLGGGGIRIDALARLNSRRTAKTDLLLTLSAGTLQTLSTGGVPERLDRVIGSSLWRRLSRHDDELSNLARISVLYRACLQRHGYAYARKIELCTAPMKPAHSQLVFATRSLSAVALMSELVCDYHRARGQSAPQLGELSERVCRFGAQLGSASPKQIMRGLAGELFGQFTAEEYRQVIGELVRRGTILAGECDQLTDEHLLSFNSSSQMALFDTDAPRHAAGA